MQKIYVTVSFQFTSGIPTISQSVAFPVPCCGVYPVVVPSRCVYPVVTRCVAAVRPELFPAVSRCVLPMVVSLGWLGSLLGHLCVVFVLLWLVVVSVCVICVVSVYSLCLLLEVSSL